MNPPPSPLRVLIVEDEMLLAMDLEQVVTDCGHIVVGEAVCLHSAGALADGTDPDLAFVDLRLAKGTSGLDVSAMIQRRWASALVVFVTANPKAIPPDFAGAHGVIAKPFSNAGIIAALRYLAEGVSAAPPSTSPPHSFIAAPSLTARWQSRMRPVQAELRDADPKVVARNVAPRGRIPSRGRTRRPRPAPDRLN